MTEEQYKPRLGFDIRVKPPSARGRRKQAWREEEQKRPCEREDCAEKATVRVAKSPRDPSERIWLCARHAAEHNRSWNYFDGLSAEEAQKARLSSTYGDRPTWEMGKNERAAAAAKARGQADFEDPLGALGEDGAPARADAGSYREGRKLPRLQVKAFETLDLKVTAPSGDIRRRYAELVRRYHPDSNGGDRSAEAQLQEVVKAHQILKKAGLC